MDYGKLMTMMQQGIPTIDKIPVEDAVCPDKLCLCRSPRIQVMGFSAVVCPNCKRVYVDEHK